MGGRGRRGAPGPACAIVTGPAIAAPIRHWRNSVGRGTCRHLHTPDGRGRDRWQRRAGGRLDGRRRAMRREQILVTRISPSKARPRRKAKTGIKKVQREEPRDLHAPVLGDDRRRPAARAVPRHPRTQQPTRAFAAVILQTVSTSSRAQRWPTRCASIPRRSTTLYTNMVAAGEAGGILDTILKRLALHREDRQAEGQVKSAMIYPVAVIVIAAIVVAVHSLEGHPDLRDAVRGPRRRAAAADAGRHRGCGTSSALLVAIIMVGVIGAIGVRVSATTRPTGRRVIDGILLKMPILGMHPAQDRGGALLPDAVTLLSPRACRFSTASRSRRARPATRSSRTRSW